MSYEKKTVSKSICIVYHTEKQIVTKIFLSHSGFAFAIAKVNKKVGFGKCFFSFFLRLLQFVAVVAVVAVSFTERGRLGLSSASPFFITSGNLIYPCQFII